MFANVGPGGLFGIKFNCFVDSILVQASTHLYLHHLDWVFLNVCYKSPVTSEVQTRLLYFIDLLHWVELGFGMGCFIFIFWIVKTF